MFNIQVSNEIILYAKKLLTKHNFGRRGVADGNYDEQLTGLIGQCTIQKIFGFPLMTGEGGFDDGKDFIYADKIIDVKTMGRTTNVRDYYVNNFIGLQKNYKTEVYIFCSLNKKTNILTVCGWVSKPQLFERAKLYKKGTKRFRSDGTYFRTKADLYEIKNTGLNQVISPDDLKKQLKNDGKKVTN